MSMRVILAPMEGVLDSLVRELLSEVNDYDLCITEFCGWLINCCLLNLSTAYVLNCTIKAVPSLAH